MAFAELVQDWGGFERLVAELHETGDVSVERDVTLMGGSGASRQIDVLIRHRHGLYEHLIIAECKYWSTAVDRTAVDILATTVRELGASRGVIFSTKGFQAGAIQQAKHVGVDLFTVRDLTAEEWGLPGRVIDMFLQVIQRSFGGIRFDGVMFIGNPSEDRRATIPLELGIDGFTSITPTLKRDGSAGGEPLEKYLLDGIKQALDHGLAEVHMVNGGEECTRYVGIPVNLNPTTPFMVPIQGGVVIVPKISFVLGLRIDQSRITIDRAQQYKFAVALENFITGSVTAASRPIDTALTTLTELGTEEEVPEGEALANGMLMRVIAKGFFPFEEMEGLTPVPIAKIKRPFVPPPLP